MKKPVVILSTLVLCISLFTAITAYAEDFTLHGGVTFDMSPDEMIAKEKENGLKPREIKNGTISLATEWGANHEYDFSDYSAVYEVSGSFINDSFKTIYYFFDKDEKLCQMIYAGTSCYSTPQNIENINAALADLYVEKYGDYETTVYDFPDIIDMQDLPSLKKADTDVLVYKLSLIDSCYQWLYPYDDKNAVDIEIQGLKWIVTGNYSGAEEYPAYSPIIGYTRISVEDIENAKQENVDKVQQTIDDI